MSRITLIAGFSWGAVNSRVSRGAVMIVSEISWKDIIVIPGISWESIIIVPGISWETAIFIFGNPGSDIILRIFWGIGAISRIVRKTAAVSIVICIAIYIIICIIICIVIILVQIALPWESYRLIRVGRLIAGGIVSERDTISRANIHVAPVHVLAGTIIWYLRGSRFTIFQVEAAAVLRIMFCNCHGGKNKNVNSSKNYNGCQYAQYAHPPSRPYLPIENLFTSLFGPVRIIPCLIHILLILVVAALVSIISDSLHNARPSQHLYAVPCKIIHPEREVNRASLLCNTAPPIASEMYYCMYTAITSTF